MSGIEATFITSIILFAIGRFATTENPQEANGWLIFLGCLLVLGLVA